MSPAYYYHREHGAKLVKDEEELKKLGKGWVDSPAKCGLVPSEKDYRPHLEKDPAFEDKSKKDA